ncbi:hypothetical protein Cadr_000004968 [Camelus dromedarius]|uniref:Uncharacterized protein n=1 Tax=Camelus dromedarius TaxID=9838 RepID=A0A5N4ECB3_CAMDR|nr:hypothetical protein Cadr_000004968 [Camelus dromedarius]
MDVELVCPGPSAGFTTRELCMSVGKLFTAPGSLSPCGYPQHNKKDLHVTDLPAVQDTAAQKSAQISWEECPQEKRLDHCAIIKFPSTMKKIEISNPLVSEHRSDRV